jgi:hypothetical protein
MRACWQIAGMKKHNKKRSWLGMVLKLAGRAIDIAKVILNLIDLIGQFLDHFQ